MLFLGHQPLLHDPLYLSSFSSTQPSIRQIWKKSVMSLLNLYKMPETQSERGCGSLLANVKRLQ